MSIADAMRHGKLDRIERERTDTFGDAALTRAIPIRRSSPRSKIDEELGVIRVTRVVNAVAAGRILNTKTAHSQIMGGVVWGIGMALHEKTLVDHA